MSALPDLPRSIPEVDDRAARDLDRLALISERNQPHDKGATAAQMLTATRDAIVGKLGGEFPFVVTNRDRSIGARLSGEIARRHGNLGMSDRPITLKLSGSAGQSFGAWNAGGLILDLEGEANDYVGKGMAGGKIVVRPPRDAASWILNRHNI